MINSAKLLADACTDCLNRTGGSSGQCWSACAGDEPGSKITNPILPVNLQGLSGEEFLAKLLPAIITLLLVVGTIGFFFMLIIGAIQWILSGGDKASVESARGRITSALIGLVLLFSTFAIASLVENFFSINILTIDIGPLKIQ